MTFLVANYSNQWYFFIPLIIANIRGDIMKNIMHVLTLSHQVSLAESFGINTNILDTNLINLAIVIGVLFYFGKGVCASWTPK